MPDSNAEQLAIEVLARIGDLEKNMKRANALTAKAYSDMAKGSKSATRQMEADMVRSTTRINQAVALTAGKIGDAGKAFAGNLARNALAAGVALLSVGALVNQTKQALDEFGNIADKSAQSGLDAEFFQELSYGASLAGVGMDELSSALNTFSKNSGLAVVGKGKMVQALLKLNPALLENIRNAKSQEERVKLAANAIDQAKTASEKAAIATTLFGNAGAALVPVFSGGADAIEQMAVKARQLGIIVDNELIARADELGDEYETVTKVLDVQFKQALINLGPVMIAAAQLAIRLSDALSTIVDSWRALDQQSNIGLNRQLATIGKQRLDLENQILDAQKAQSDEAEKMSETAKNLGFADTKNPVLPGGNIDELKAQSAELKKQELAIVAIQTARNEAAKQVGDGTGNSNDTADTPPLPPISTGGSTRNQAAEDALRQAEAVKKLIADLQFEQSLIGKSQVEQAKMNALRQAGAAATEEQKTQIASIIEASAKEKAAIEATAQSVELQRDIAKGALTDITTAFEDGKITAQEWADVVSNMFRKVADAIINNLVNMAITPANGGFNLFGALLGLGGATAGGGVSAGAGGVTGQAPAALPSALRTAAARPAAASEMRVKFVNDGLNISAEVETVADGRITKHTPGMIKKGVQDYSRHVLPGDVKKIVNRPRDRRLDR